MITKWQKMLILLPPWSHGPSPNIPDAICGHVTYGPRGRPAARLLKWTIFDPRKPLPRRTRNAHSPCVGCLSRSKPGQARPPRSSTTPSTSPKRAPLPNRSKSWEELAPHLFRFEGEEEVEHHVQHKSQVHEAVHDEQRVVVRLQKRHLRAHTPKCRRQPDTAIR